MPTLRFQLRIKYAFDRLLAAGLLVMLSPLAPLIAIAIKLDSRGSILFLQKRVGLAGRTFTIYKFRSMVENADDLLDARGGVSSNRISRVGRVLRRTSLDELPQLLNIVRGEMSFIGPRPGLSERHQRYTPRQQRRCEMKPGVTGLAQVSGRNTLPWSRRVELDIQYVDQYSWSLDLKILAQTAWSVLTGAGLVLDRNPEQADDIADSAACSAANMANANETGVVRRVERELIGHYRKDGNYEDLLRNLNLSLTASHDRGLLDLPDRYSTIHVVGAPRSGTTLLTQLLSGCLDVGYINNLIAAFWRVPCYGIRLSEQLLRGTRPENYRSDFGRTSSIAEPHEFGYFWSHLLGYPEMAEQDEDFEQEIDWGRLRRVLANMAQTFGKPVVFKSFLLGWHIRRMREILPRCIFLWIRRDAVDNALSLIKAREAQLGSVEQWVSMKPREYDWLQHEPAWTQVAGQVYYVERAIAREIARSDGRNVLEVSYREMCSAPQGVLNDVCAMLEQNGRQVQVVRRPPERFERPSNRSMESPFYGRVQAAVERFYKEGEVGAYPLRRAG